MGKRGGRGRKKKYKEVRNIERQEPGATLISEVRRFEYCVNLDGSFVV